jgi:hypothetical protein
MLGGAVWHTSNPTEKTTAVNSRTAEFIFFMFCNLDFPGDELFLFSATGPSVFQN